jgi:hypothetical protein
MKAIAIWILACSRPAALVLAAAAIFFVMLPRRGAADDGAGKIDANDLNTKFLQRVREADNLQLREQMRQTLERKAAEKEPRQFQWDAVDRAPPKGNAPKAAFVREARPAAQFQVKVFKKNRAGAQTLMVFADGDVQVVVEAVLAAGDADDAEEGPAGQVPPKQQFQIAAGSCEQLLFGNGRDEGDARRQLVARLSQKLAAVNRAYGLTESQLQKLNLAGRGDIHRLFEQAAQMRSKIEAVQTINPGNAGALLQQIMAVSAECRPLRGTFDAGPFGEGSLFAKALRRMLTPEQANRGRDSVP